MTTSTTTARWSKRASMAAVLAALMVTEPAGAAGPDNVSCPPHAIIINPGEPIQDAVRAAQPGTAFCLRSGIHRLQSIQPKDGQAFIGELGAILNGAIELGGFERQGRVWVASNIQRRNRSGGECLKQYPACNRTDGIYLNDVPLQPVATLGQLSPGSFYFDHAAGRLYLADDPTGKRVEQAAIERAFVATPVRGVTIRNLIVEKYAGPAQQAAISSGRLEQGATGWIIENNDVRLNTGVGIAAGPGSTVRANKIHHNGQLGITVTATGVLIEDNDIDHNNTYGFDATWEAGGLKATRTEQMIVRNNRVRNNLGVGLWCDIDCKHVVIENNTVEHNADIGIFYEISSDGIIRHNAVTGNGTGAKGQRGRAWVWGADIMIAASSRVDVHNNTLTVDHKSTGLMLVDQGRKKVKERPDFYTERDGCFPTSDVYVHHNTVVYTGRSGVSGGASDVAASHPHASIIQKGNNRFDFNTYTGSRNHDGRWFVWGRTHLTFDGFRALGQEANGKLILKD
jgi:parallel beta-helix repeat protein